MLPVAPIEAIVKSSSHSQPWLVAKSKSNTPVVANIVPFDFILIVISERLPPPVALIKPPIFPW